MRNWSQTGKLFETCGGCGGDDGRTQPEEQQTENRLAVSEEETNSILILIDFFRDLWKFLTKGFSGSALVPDFWHSVATV